MCWDLDGGSYVVHKGESRRMNENTFYESRSSERVVVKRLWL